MGGGICFALATLFALFWVSVDGPRWLIEIDLVISGETFTFYNDAVLCLARLYPPIGQTDLIQRHSEAANLLGQASGEIEEQALGQALQLGTEGEGTLTDAAELLRAALGQADRILSEANELPAGYAPLIENYLRAISYEE